MTWLEQRERDNTRNETATFEMGHLERPGHKKLQPFAF
jgi:hypothetical protein